MKAAILFRGHSHRDVGRTRHWGIDWRKCVASHRKFLISPLREMMDERVDIFISSYETPHLLDIEADYNPYRTKWLSDGTQKSCMLAGLDRIDTYQGADLPYYDLITICRFDLEIKGNPFAHPGFRPDKINFLWREWGEEAWRDHKRVPDALHFLPGKLLDGFRRGIEKTPSDICLHTIYRPVAAEVGEESLNVMAPEGFVDSNTDVMPNVFYHMVRVMS